MLGLILVLVLVDLNYLDRDFFDFDIKGRFEFEGVSGTLTRAVQYKRGVNRAYQLLTENVKFDNSLNKNDISF